MKSKRKDIWERLYESYKDQYTKEQINEMTFAELCELIDGMEYNL
jgi:hypothetical protein